MPYSTVNGVDLAGRVAGIGLPVLIVNGAHDNSLPGGRDTAARHEIIADAGHLCILERPEAFDALVTEFLDGIPGG